MERPEIVELFYSALFSPNDVEQLFKFLWPRVEWILSAADPQTLGEELPSNAIKFSGTEGFRQLALYFRDRLHVLGAGVEYVIHQDDVGPLPKPVLISLC